MPGGSTCTFAIHAILILCFTLPLDATAELLINEVLYDPEGVDTGKEFVEILNTGPYAVTLEGVTLEAGDGAHPDDWELIWIGSAERAIPPGGYYRVGLDGPGMGEPAALKLQNGPDGVRLAKQRFELDRVGWGLHRYGDYFEGSPAPAARSGESLARAEDGLDTDDNGTDFVVAAPTPGRPNRPRDDWEVRFHGHEPEVPGLGEGVRVRIRLTNRGTQLSFPPQIEVDDAVRPFLLGFDRPIDAGESAERTVVMATPSIRGRQIWSVRHFAEDEVPENDVDSLRVQVGAGPVQITEILAAPGPEGTEWVEVALDLDEGDSIEGLLFDVRGRTVALAPRTASGRARVGLIVADSTVMRQRYPDLPEEMIWSYAGSWPRLRDGRRSDEVADTLRLISSDRCVLALALPGSAPAPGVSLERVAGVTPEGPAAWSPCTEAVGSTPGEVNLRGGGDALESPLTIRPRIVRPGVSSCRITGSVGAHPGEVRLEVIDLLGTTVRCLVDGTWVAGLIAAEWDGLDDHGRTVVPGIYVAEFEVSRTGTVTERFRAPVAVTPGEGQ